mmetsp:Transcript_20909/g.48888  ORF Transcript_20909/g.48888 Transcript_20909/m.48888 type:complete len:475 (+) Transcript_20909:4798-6222(+)
MRNDRNRRVEGEGLRGGAVPHGRRHDNGARAFRGTGDTGENGRIGPPHSGLGGGAVQASLLAAIHGAKRSANQSHSGRTSRGDVRRGEQAESGKVVGHGIRDAAQDVDLSDADSEAVMGASGRTGEDRAVGDPAGGFGATGSKTSVHAAGRSSQGHTKDGNTRGTRRGAIVGPDGEEMLVEGQGRDNGGGLHLGHGGGDIQAGLGAERGAGLDSGLRNPQGNLSGSAAKTRLDSARGDALSSTDDRDAEGASRGLVGGHQRAQGERGEGQSIRQRADAASNSEANGDGAEHALWRMAKQGRLGNPGGLHGGCSTHACSHRARKLAEGEADKGHLGCASAGKVRSRGRGDDRCEADHRVHGDGTAARGDADAPNTVAVRQVATKGAVGSPHSHSQAGGSKAAVTSVLACAERRADNGHADVASGRRVGHDVAAESGQVVGEDVGPSASHAEHGHNEAKHARTGGAAVRPSVNGGI